MRHGKIVLVTGGAGFIGSHLVDALVRRGDRVRVLDNLLTGKLENLRGLLDRIELIRADIRNEAALRRALRGVRVVYHQAALRSVPQSVKDPAGYHEVNATGTLTLLRLAGEAGVRRVVYASSSSVYGDSNQLPQRENQLPRPQSPYAASKLAGEIYAGMFTQLYRLETVGLRYFNVFGPRQSLQNRYAVVIPQFITCLLRGTPTPIDGDGRQTRDFTYIDDVVRANLLAGTARGAAGQVFNVAGGAGHSVRELAQRLNRVMGLRIAPTFRSARSGDIRHSHADLSLVRRILGYRPQVSFEAGLRQTIAWFDQNRQQWEQSR